MFLMNQTIIHDNCLTNTTTENFQSCMMNLFKQNFKTLSILLYLNNTCYIWMIFVPMTVGKKYQDHTKSRCMHGMIKIDDDIVNTYMYLTWCEL